MTTDGPLLVYSPLNDPRRPTLTRLRELSPDLVLLTESQSEPPQWATRLFQDVVHIDRTQVAGAVALLEQLGFRRGVRPSGIVSLSETGLYFCARLAGAMGLRFLDPEILRRARDKSWMRWTFAKDGLPTVPFGVAETLDEALRIAGSIGYPVVLKPLLAGGSLFVRVVSDAGSLTSVFAESLQGGADVVAGDPLVQKTFDGGRRPRLLVERLIGGERMFDSALPLPVGEISVEGCVVGGRVQVLARHDKPLPANGPYFEEVLWSSPSRLPADYLASVDRLAEQAVRSLGLDETLFHVEMRTTADGPVLLEVAARMGGGPIFRSALLSMGVDLVEVMVDIAVGRARGPASPARPLLDVVTFGLFAEEGHLMAIENLDDVRAHPSVVEACVYEHPGTVIARAPRSDHCTVHVMVVAADFARAEAAGIFATGAVRFVTRDVAQ